MRLRLLFALLLATACAAQPTAVPAIPTARGMSTAGSGVPTAATNAATSAPRQASAVPPPTTATVAIGEYTDGNGDRIYGKPDAPVTLTDFSDFL